MSFHPNSDIVLCHYSIPSFSTVSYIPQSDATKGRMSASSIQHPASSIILGADERAWHMAEQG